MSVFVNKKIITCWCVIALAAVSSVTKYPGNPEAGAGGLVPFHRRLQPDRRTGTRECRSVSYLRFPPPTGGGPCDGRRLYKFPAWLEAVLDNIRQVESSGQSNPPPGDGGRAVGPYQLHKAAVDDVNRMFGVRFNYSDRTDTQKARLIAGLYISGWLEVHRAEIAARIYNGGPRGWRKQSTNAYWAKLEGRGNE